MKLKTSNAIVIMSQDWDDFVSEVYGRPYCFQQQDGCKGRGTFFLTVPYIPYSSIHFEDEVPDYPRESLLEGLDCEEMGVRFSSWLSRDPSKEIHVREISMDWALLVWWERKFYPSIEMVANDLHARGLLDAGEYIIVIDW